MVADGPQEGVGAGPEVLGEGLDVGGNHGLEAVVDDGEGVVGPEVAADVGEVLVFEEELVSEFSVEHELGLEGGESGTTQILNKEEKGKRGERLTGGVMSLVILSCRIKFLFPASLYSAMSRSRNAYGPL